VNNNEPVEVTPAEWEKLKACGRFAPMLDEELEVKPGLMKFSSPREPAEKLPHDWSNMQIVVKIVGGVGDAIVCTGLVNELKRKDCHVTMAVRRSQLNLIGAVRGVDKVLPAERLNDVSVRGEFDVLLKLNHAFTKGRQIIDMPYYDAVAEWVKCLEKLQHPTLLLSREQIGRLMVLGPKQPMIALHAGASNPIRRWPEPYWKELATRLQSKGFSVLWLGSEEDYGFEDENVVRACGISTELLDQTCLLWCCKYFVGNDSGFAHLAGTMGIPGTVLFSATKPEHVIDRYESLQGISTAEEMQYEPSRSLQNDDKAATRCMMALTVDRVLAAMPPRMFEDVQRPAKKRRSKIGPIQVEKAKVRRVQVNSPGRVLYILPSLWMGGGEINAANLIKQLSRWFKMDVAVVQLIGDSSVFPPIVDLLEASVDKLEMFRESGDMARLREFIDESSYDVILYHEVSNDVTLLLNSMEIRPAMVRIHRTDEARVNVSVKRTRQLVDELVCVSDVAAEELEGKWIFNGVVPERIDVSAEPLAVRRDAESVVGYLGRMNPAKGIQFLIELVPRMKNVKLVIAGVRNENDIRLMQRWMKNAGAEGKIQMFKSLQNVAAFYKTINMNILINSHEGCPSNPMEAA